MCTATLVSLDACIKVVPVDTWPPVDTPRRHSASRRHSPPSRARKCVEYDRIAISSLAIWRWMTKSVADPERARSRARFWTGFAIKLRRSALELYSSIPRGLPRALRSKTLARCMRVASCGRDIALALFSRTPY